MEYQGVRIVVLKLLAQFVGGVLLFFCVLVVDTKANFMVGCLNARELLVFVNIVLLHRFFTDTNFE